MISYKGLTKAEALAALWNGSRCQGLSFFGADLGHTHMTADEAQKIIDERKNGEGLYFDYLEGRVLKVDLRTDDECFNEALYDRDLGPGAAQRVISHALAQKEGTDEVSEG